MTWHQCLGILLIVPLLVFAEPETDEFGEPSASETAAGTAAEQEAEFAVEPDDVSAPPASTSESSPVTSVGESAVEASQSSSYQVSSSSLERYNRGAYQFNNALDTYFLKPVAQGYQFVMPSVVDNGISNIFNNMGEIPTTINAVLQGKPAAAGKTVFRFFVNTTFGLLGFFDVATMVDVDRQKEDFSQTLAVWGVPRGDYLVLPFWGPSTMRDAPSLIVDGFLHPLSYIEDDATYYGVWALDIVDERADLLAEEKLITGDRYAFIKQAYLLHREYLEKDGKVEDTFDQDAEQSDDWME